MRGLPILSFPVEQRAFACISAVATSSLNSSRRSSSSSGSGCSGGSCSFSCGDSDSENINNSEY